MPAIPIQHATGSVCPDSASDKLGPVSLGYLLILSVSLDGHHFLLLVLCLWTSPKLNGALTSDEDPVGVLLLLFWERAASASRVDCWLSLD